MDEFVSPQRIGLLYKNTSTKIFVSISVAIAIAIYCWQYIPEFAPSGWLFSILTCYTLFFIVTRTYLVKGNTAHSSHASWWAIFIFGMALSGILWSYLAFNLPLSNQWYLITLLVALLFLTITSLACYPEHPEATITFALSALLPSIVKIAPYLKGNHEMTIILLSLLVVVIILSTFLMGYFAHQKNALNKAYKKLLAEFNHYKQKADDLDTKLRTNINTHKATETKLKETQASFNHAEHKAKALALVLKNTRQEDTKTQLFNAKHFNKLLSDEWQRQKRSEKPISLLAIEIDNFTQLQTQNNENSAAIMVQVADMIKQRCRRPGDCAARIKDGYFYMLLSGADTQNSIKIANQLRQDISKQVSQEGGDAVTISLGIVTVVPNENCNIEELKEYANNSLNEAKFQGNNKVVQHRIFDSRIKQVHWPPLQLADLSAEELKIKLSMWGYKVIQKQLAPGTCIRDIIAKQDMIDSILNGCLKITIDGFEYKLNRGDCLFIPKGTNRSIEVVSDKPVNYFLGIKNE